MKKNKIIALLAVATMLGTTLFGCGNASTNEGGDAPAEETSGEEASSEGTAEGGESQYAGVEISFFNSKGEIQTALEEIAVAFEEETGIKVEIQAAGVGESPFTKITSAYNSGTAPTMAMLDGSDIIALAEEYALDLSGEEWMAEVEGNTLDVNGTVYSFPFCVEGRGLIYNKTAIEETLGTEFDPSTINSYDALAQLLSDLREGGMEFPVVLSKEDWSLGQHQLAYIYENYDGTTAGTDEILAQLTEGSVDLLEYDRFNQFVDTFDLLAEYNINGEDPLGALYEQDPIYLADGDSAIWFNGVWAWLNIEDSGASVDDEYGFLPYVLGNDTEDYANTNIIAAPTKQVMIDAVQATEEQVGAAKEFLNWLVYSETGQRMLVEDAAIIPAAANNTNQAVDPLGRAIQEKMEAGEVSVSVAFTPSDHWSVLGASMQKYLGGEATKEELAAEITEYWTGLQ